MTQVQQKISKEELNDMVRRISAYESIIVKMMHSPPQDLQELQKKIIDAGIKMGLDFHGTQEHSYDEDQVIGDMKITGKYMTADGIRFNVAKLDGDGDIIRCTMRQCITEQDLTTMIENNNQENNNQ